MSKKIGAISGRGELIWGHHIAAVAYNLTGYLDAPRGRRFALGRLTGDPAVLRETLNKQDVKLTLADKTTVGVNVKMAGPAWVDVYIKDPIRSFESKGPA